MHHPEAALRIRLQSTKYLKVHTQKKREPYCGEPQQPRPDSLTARRLNATTTSIKAPYLNQQPLYSFHQCPLPSLHHQSRSFPSSFSAFRLLAGLVAGSSSSDSSNQLCYSLFSYSFIHGTPFFISFLSRSTSSVL